RPDTPYCRGKSAGVASPSVNSSSVSSAPADTRRQRSRNPLRAIIGIPFGWQVLIGLVLGVALGLVAAQIGPVPGAGEDGDDGPNWLTTTLDTIGSTFVSLLTALVPPLIFLAIVTSIANLREVTNAARLAGKTLLWFAITALISVLLGIGLGALTDPGAGGEVGRKADPFLRVASSGLAIVQKLLWWVIRLAPIGTIGLLGNAVASYGWDAIGQLGVFTADVYIGMLIVLLAIYPILLKLNGLSIGSFFRGVWPATSLGFVSRSSLGTMPMTQTVTERMGVPRHYASFAIPLGATTKMDGCASIYPSLAAIFVANFYGVPLGVTDYLLIVLVSVLGSAATAGMTGATVM